MLAASRRELFFLLVALTAKHKALVAVVVLGAAAVGFDQFLLSGGSGPSSAPVAAEDLVIRPGASAGEKDAAPLPSAEGAGRGTVMMNAVQRLNVLAARAVDEDGGRVDAIAIPEHWLVQIREAARAAEEAAKPKAAAEEKKHAELKLTAVVCQNGQPLQAMINGQLVPMGSSIGEYTLLEMQPAGKDGPGSPATAKLAGPEGELILRMDGPNPRNTSENMPKLQ